MKKILIYGDSNTWGDNFITGIRIKDELQWPNILQKKLGNKYKVIGEGLPGRIAGNFELDKPFKNGIDNFISTFRTCSPIDIIIIALGTNDLQVKYNRNSEEIINDLLWYRDSIIEQFSDSDNVCKYFNNELPRIIYILPPMFDIIKSDGIFNDISEENRLKLKNLKNKYNDVIVLHSLPLLDDGIHLSIEGHKMLASIVGDYINE